MRFDRLRGLFGRVCGVFSPLRAVMHRARDWFGAKLAALPRARPSVLGKRIVFINLIVFFLLILGVIAVQSSREGLVDERLTGIEEQARIIANTLAERGANPDTLTLDILAAEPLMRDLLAPVRLRARLYDNKGNLLIDTRNLLPRNMIQVSDLPPIDDWSRLKQWFSRMLDYALGVRPLTDLAPYFETVGDGRAYSEVAAALTGATQSAERLDENNKLVLSAAVPIQRFKAVYGAVLVSTEEGDIDGILREERITLLQFFLLAMAVMLLSGIYLSRAIVDPVIALAEAAETVRAGRSGREGLPDMSARHDEIGDLSVNLAAMTRAFYSRIDAIESFAADVAHEIKNPLTSLKSAVEMFARATDGEARARLLEVIRLDVKRVDRLITDISDASRIDAELSRESRQAVEVERLLETIHEIYGYTTLPHGVTLDLDLRLPPHVLVLGQAERLGQVIRNLIDNAVSFSPAGATVTVVAWADFGKVCIAVDDNGPGIPPENLEAIFARFYTSRPTEQGFGNNSGLGLSIVRQIVTGHGGRVWAENRNHGGARFIVELPEAFST